MKLFHHTPSRSDRVRWTLEELGVSYEPVQVDITKGEQKRAEYHKIHPLGKVPALQDGSLVLFESAAICLYLVDKYADKNLAPPMGTTERALFYQWIFFAMATLERPSLDYLFHAVLWSPEKRSAEKLDDAKKKLRQMHEVLNNNLRRKKFMLGNQFSLADILVASMIFYQRDILEEFPEVKRYVKDIKERPAFRRTMVSS